MTPALKYTLILDETTQDTEWIQTKTKHNTEKSNDE